MMKYFFVLTSILLCSAFSSNRVYAQLDFKQGFIINHEQDTIVGQVGIKKLNQYYKFCYFKEQNSKKARKYSTSEILGFGVDRSLCFVSINLEGSTESSKEHFAQLLVRGKTSLLKKNNLYYLFKDNKYYSLDGDFKKTLSELMTGCKSIKYDIILSKKEDNGLSGLVERYNECIGSSSETYHYEPKKIMIRPSIGAGVFTSQLDLSIQNKDGVSSKNSAISNDFHGGISVDLIFTKFSRKLSFNTGVYYQKFNYLLDFNQEIESRYSTYPPETIYEETHISYSSIQLPITMKYNIPVNLWNFYFGAGFTFHFSSDFASESHVETEIENVINTNSFENEISLRDTQQGLIFIAGLDRILGKNICLGGEIKAELSNGSYSSQNDYYDVQSKTKRLYCTIFYKF